MVPQDAARDAFWSTSKLERIPKPSTTIAEALTVQLHCSWSALQWPGQDVLRLQHDNEQCIKNTNKICSHQISLGWSRAGQVCVCVFGGGGTGKSWTFLFQKKKKLQIKSGCSLCKICKSVNELNKNIAFSVVLTMEAQLKVHKFTQCHDDLCPLLCL